MNSSDQSPTMCPSVRHALIRTIEDRLPNLGNTYVSMYHTQSEQNLFLCENVRKL